MDGCICTTDAVVNPDCKFCMGAIKLARQAEAVKEIQKAEKRIKQREAAEIKAAKEARGERINAKLRELFAPYTNFAIANVRESSFTIEFEEHETSFEDLKKISDAFGTVNINMGSERRNGGFCDTCGYSYTVNFVTVNDVSEDWR